MSTTRHAAHGIPFRQERFASSEAYRSSLNALLVAKRCALLRQDPELRDLIWLIQEQSLADPFNVGNRSGSIDQVATELLALAGYTPTPRRVVMEDLETGESWAENSGSLEDAGADMRADLVGALSELALDPRRPSEAMPGLGRDWRKVLLGYRAQVKERAKQTVAATSVLKSVVDALRFTRETGMPSLSMGVSRLGKSAGAKAFCAGSGGLARYVLTPEDDQMGSFYRAIAKALGVAESLSKKDADVRELVEKTLQTSRLMLVFDEAHNLFCGCRRLRREPGRVLWLRRLIDGGVPVAFVALPDFKGRVARYVDQLDWDAAQITDIIARETTLSPELQTVDFELLVARLAGDFPTACKTLIAAAAKAQRGAQYVADVIQVSRHLAEKAGREVAEGDVTAAIGARPQFQNESSPRRPAPRERSESMPSLKPIQQPPRQSSLPVVTARGASVAIPLVTA